MYNPFYDTGGMPYPPTPYPLPPYPQMWFPAPPVLYPMPFPYGPPDDADVYFFPPPPDFSAF